MGDRSCILLPSRWWWLATASAANSRRYARQEPGCAACGNPKSRLWPPPRLGHGGLRSGILPVTSRSPPPDADAPQAGLSARPAPAPRVHLKRHRVALLAPGPSALPYCEMVELNSRAHVLRARGGPKGRVNRPCSSAFPPSRAACSLRSWKEVSINHGLSSTRSGAPSRALFARDGAPRSVLTCGNRPSGGFPRYPGGLGTHQGRDPGTHQGRDTGRDPGTRQGTCSRTRRGAPEFPARGRSGGSEFPPARRRRPRWFGGQDRPRRGRGPLAPAAFGRCPRPAGIPSGPKRRPASRALRVPSGAPSAPLDPGPGRMVPSSTGRAFRRRAATPPGEGAAAPAHRRCEDPLRSSPGRAGDDPIVSDRERVTIRSARGLGLVTFRSSSRHGRV